MGWIKELILQHIYSKKGELESSSLLDWNRAKGSPPEKRNHWKRKNAYSKLRGVVTEGRGDVDGDVDEWEPGILITSPCDSVLVSEGSAQKEGLHRRCKPILWEGGLVLTQHLITWSGNRQSTRHLHRVITRWPGALLEISQFFHMLAVRPFIIHHYFLTGEDDYSQDRFPALQALSNPWESYRLWPTHCNILIVIFCGKFASRSPRSESSA